MKAALEKSVAQSGSSHGGMTEAFAEPTEPLTVGEAIASQSATTEEQNLSAFADASDSPGELAGLSPEG